MNIVMVAAENGAIPGGKVGGMGDVIRDIPNALADLGHRVDVVVPGYQAFSRHAGASRQLTLEVRFRRTSHQVEVFLLELPGTRENVRCWIIDHPLLAPNRPGEIYCDDPPERPFATDASKFAFFSAAVCQLLVSDAFGHHDVIHLHDWHTAFIAILARFDPRFRALQPARFVFTIHNLALQGIRPLAGDESSLASWFPHLQYRKNDIVDPRYGNCLNPMRAAIRLCDKVHAVSPSYAREIQRPNDAEKGFHGGEGLEADLQAAHQAGKLVGILNGCEYGDGGKPAKPGLAEFLTAAEQQLDRWIADRDAVPSVHYLALKRIAAMSTQPPTGFVTSIGRLTPQKVQLYTVPMPDGKSCIDAVLDTLPAHYLFIMLGSGDHGIERFFTTVAARRDNFLFIQGYSEKLPPLVYALGQLFLMPSTFEPCGISQMLAMREGQPCLVHGVGGLADTIVHNEDGFVFTGDNLQQQAVAFVDALHNALKLREFSPAKWQKLAGSAACKRFLWQDAAVKYCSELYIDEGTIHDAGA